MLDNLTGGNIGMWKMVAEDTGELQFYFPEGLTLGILYNEVIVGCNRIAGGWKTLWETRVKDPVEFHKLRLDLCTGRLEFFHEDEVPSLFVQDTSYVLLLRLGKGGSKLPGKNIDHPWWPTSIGEYTSHLETFPEPPWN